MHERYFEAAIREEVRKLVEARPGARNSVLNSAAYSLATLGIPEQIIRNELTRAAEQSGLIKDDGRKAAEVTIASGMKAGYAHPRQAQWPSGFGGSSYRQKPSARTHPPNLKHPHHRNRGARFKFRRARCPTRTANQGS
jgi:hypothetical protein